jgi:hypothetical protein
MKTALLIITCWCCCQVHAQGDFLILRKKNITQQVFFTGQFVQFEIEGNGWITGTLKQIKKDSIFIDLQYTKQVVNYWGMPTIDTVRLGIAKYSIYNIKAVPVKRKYESMFANGSFLTVASGGYILLNIVNGLVRNEPIFTGQNATNLAIAAGVLGIGVLQITSRKDKISIGTKYTLHTTGTLKN